MLLVIRVIMCLWLMMVRIISVIRVIVGRCWVMVVVVFLWLWQWLVWCTVGWSQLLFCSSSVSEVML